jgi:hypothetical protein
MHPSGIARERLLFASFLPFGQPALSAQSGRIVRSDWIMT